VRRQQLGAMMSQIMSMASDMRSRGIGTEEFIQYFRECVRELESREELQSREEGE
jgi:hypothetical protein